MSGQPAVPTRLARDGGAASNGPCRIVVVGGGFAGLYAATYLAAADLPPGRVRVTLISDSDHFTFTPLLAEVLGGNLGAEHVTVPYRALARRYGFGFRLGRVTGLDPVRRIVHSTLGEHSYDYAILALGARPRDFSAAREAAVLPFGQVRDALAIRSRVIHCAERAVETGDARARRRWLTWIVGGGGPAGVEAAAEIHCLLAELLPRFYGLSGWRVVLVESGDRLLRGWDERLAEEGLRRMRLRGIEVHLGVRVDRFDGTVARIASDHAQEDVDAATLVWTAGSVPATEPLAASGFSLTPHGHVPVDADLRVEGCERVFAAGDAAFRINPRTGSPYPAVAPIAISQGVRAAANIENLVMGRPLEEYTAHHAGKIVSLGGGIALADVLGLRLTGRPAWALYRITYLLKLVGVGNKARALTTLALNRVFGRSLAALS